MSQTESLYNSQAKVISEQTAEIARLRAEAAVKDQTITALQAHIEELKKIAAAYARGNNHA